MKCFPSPLENDRKFPVHNRPEKFENTTWALATKAVNIQLYLMARGRSCLATMFLVESCSVLASWFPCEHLNTLSGSRSNLQSQ